MNKQMTSQKTVWVSILKKPKKESNKYHKQEHFEQIVSQNRVTSKLSI